MAVDIIARGMSSRLNGLITDSGSLATNVTNNTASSLYKWKKVRGTVLAGEGRAKLAVVGSSTPAGTGAGSGVDFRDNARAKGFAARLAQTLTSRGLPANMDNFFGTSGYFTELATYDPRWTNLAGATQSVSTSTTLGGRFILMDTGTSNVTIQPTGQFTNVDLWYSRSSTTGTFSVTIDGVFNQNIVTTNATTSLGVTSISGLSNATHTLTFNRVSGNNFLTAADCYNTSAYAVSVLGMGWGGSNVADWANNSTPARPLPALATYAPDITIVMLGSNDWNAGTDLTTFTTNFNSLVSTAKLSGDCIVVIPQYTDTAVTSAEVQDRYRNQMISVAQANNCMILDYGKRLISYSMSNANGLIRSDGLHVVGAAHSDLGMWIADILLGAS